MSKRRFVGFVDDAKVKRLGLSQELHTSLAPRYFPANREHFRTGETARLKTTFDRLDAEKPVECILPLAQQRFRHHQEYARSCTFGPQLRDHQSSLYRLSQADLVRQDAAALGEPFQLEDHRAYLMGVRIDAARPLRGGITLLFIGPPQTNELLRKVTALDGMRNNHRQTSKLLQWAIERVHFSEPDTDSAV